MSLFTLPSDPVWMMIHTVTLPILLYPGGNWLVGSFFILISRCSAWSGSGHFPRSRVSKLQHRARNEFYIFKRWKKQRLWDMDNKPSTKPNSLPDLLQNKFADPYFLFSGVKGGQIPVDQYPTIVPSGTEVGRKIIYLLPCLNLGGRLVLCDDSQ